MIRLDVSAIDIAVAKAVIETFDSKKTYNKIRCTNNYIGALGEILFNKYLSKRTKNYVWKSFIKELATFDDPDFIINTIDVDIKTTYSNCMWFQKPKFSIYIYCRLSKDNKFLDIISFATKSMLENAIEDKTARVIKRKGRYDYVISPHDMLPIELLKI